MAQKTLNTRIQNRFDTLANWKAEGVELLQGEIALVSVTTQQIDATTGNVVSVPAVLMKVGENGTDGKPKAFSTLPWLSAKAADVYDWAKTPQAKDINVAVVTGTDGQGKDEVTTTTLGTWLANIHATSAAITADVAAIETKLSGVDETVVKTLTAAINALDSTDNLATVTRSAGRFVRAVTQKDGKVTVTYANITEDDIPEISASKVIVVPASGSTAAVTVADKFDTVEQELSSLKTSVAGGVHFVGTVNTVPTSATITVNTTTGSKTHQASVGDIVICVATTGDNDIDDREFIYNGGSWEELGDASRTATLERKIVAMSVTDKNTVTSTHKFVSQVTQADGKVAVTYTQPVAADVLYQSGNTDTVYTKINALTTAVAEKAEAGHTHSNYENQKAFSYIKVGDKTASADTVTDTIEFVGTNITIAADETNDKVTFSVAEASDKVKGIVLLGEEDGAATYEAVDSLARDVSAVESNYMRIGNDNNLYTGKDGTDVIIFNCGNAASWITA
jgi:hypothetical protein